MRKTNGFLILAMMIFAGLLLLFAVPAEAELYHAISSDDWSSPETWPGGVQPTGSYSVSTGANSISVTAKGEIFGELLIEDGGRLWVFAGSGLIGWPNSGLSGALNIQNGEVNQGGGSVSVTGINLLSGNASYNLSGSGAEGAGTESLSVTGGIFSHTGGALTGTGTGNITLTSGGRYSLAGGTLEGTWGNLSVDSTSSVSGSGIIVATGNTINNSGRITASGGTLDFSGWGTVANSVENTGTSGWYATSAGELILPKITVATGNNTYNWGEAAGDTTIDLVNSMQLAFNGVTTGGAVTISLLAADNPGAMATGAGSSPIGIFDISPPEGFAFTSVDLAFRYDDAMAVLLGITEADMKIYHYTDGAWHNVTSSVDTANNIIYATGITSFSEFGIGDGFDEGGGETVTPEPATIVSGLLGLLGLAAQRLTKKRKA